MLWTGSLELSLYLKEKRKKKKSFNLVLLPKPIYCITESLVPSIIKLLVKKLFVIPEMMFAGSLFRNVYHIILLSVASDQQGSQACAYL